MVSDLPPDLARHLFDMGITMTNRSNPPQDEVLPVCRDPKHMKGTWYGSEDDIPF